jgi:MarR family transcriptional regulator, lower aerobic nicotinate degradation pathway regulator
MIEQIHDHLGQRSAASLIPVRGNVADRDSEADAGPVEATASMRLPDELLEKSGFLMVRLAMAFKARALEALEAEGSSQYHYTVLAVVGEQAHKAQATIAAAVGLDPSQLVGILDSLEDKRLIVRERDRDDRRRHLVSLTAKGRQHLIRLRTAIDRLEDELFAPLTPADRLRLHTLLLHLASYHDAHCPDAPDS